MDLDRINLLILDVDGVLTSGRVVLDDKGGDARSFHVHDGCCVKLWHRNGLRSAIISGRRSEAVTRRARELGIEHVIQGATDKLAAYDELLGRLDAGDDQVCYVGDDLPDLAAMARCALPVAVGDAVPAVKQQARYVARNPGGAGAVAETIELILRKQRRWSRAMLLEA
jgi:3-deoxy-D-manno-octulosonate 8-phosphate phosphatase (KDO 8-P phosphatase)